MTWEDNVWKKMRKVQNQMDDVVNNIWNSNGEYFRKAWVDFDESDNEFILNVELPGMEREDIKLDISGKTLVIKAKKKKEGKDQKKGSYGLSRSYVGFSRSVSLPEDADVHGIDAAFRNGVLTVKIKKKKLKKGKDIKIR